MCIDEWLRAAFLIVAFARGGWRKRAEAQGLGQANKDLSAAAPHVKNSSFAAPGVKQDEIVGVNAPSFIGVTSLDAQRSATAADAPDLSLF